MKIPRKGDFFMVIPVSYNPCNDKTISDEISNKDNRSYNEYTIIIPLRLLIREATQRIFPYPPQFNHFFLNTPNLDNNHIVTIVHPIIYHIIYTS